MVGGTVDAGVLGTQVRGAGGTVALEVGGVEDESGRTVDASSGSGVPDCGGVAGDAVVGEVEVGKAGRTVAGVGDGVEDESRRTVDAGTKLVVPHRGKGAVHAVV